MIKPTIADVLAGQTILVTGAAGYFGLALLYRLVDPSLHIRRIYAFVRGEERLSRLPVDLHQHVGKVNENGDYDGALLVVLPGDCSIPGFGLSERENKLLEETDIVINSAGNNRFNLPLAKAVRATVDLTYNMCQFTLSSPKVRTHIQISTCFTGWYLPHGSIFQEELVPPVKPGVKYEKHANTYLHAKAMSEGVMNAIGRSPSGKVAWRIVRISTLGPAMSFPSPGWGSGHISSPLCAAVAAQVVHNPSVWIPEAVLDVVPIDIAVNQFLGLIAAIHFTGSENPLCPLPIGSNIPIYHIAAGNGSSVIPLSTLNQSCFKVSQPYIPPKNLIAAYRPMASKVVSFDTLRTRHVLGLEPLGNSDLADEKKRMHGTDVPVDVTNLAVDLDAEVARNGGWEPYLRTVRDIMENMS